jgi:hypothetical protein
MFLLSEIGLSSDSVAVIFSSLAANSQAARKRPLNVLSASGTLSLNSLALETRERCFLTRRRLRAGLAPFYRLWVAERSFRSR